MKKKLRKPVKNNCIAKITLYANESSNMGNCGSVNTCNTGNCGSCCS